MKKIKILCAALLTIGLFTACKGASGGDNNSGKDPDVKPSNEEALSVYKKFIGTTWKRNGKPSAHDISQYPETIIFTVDSITFDNVTYSLNQDTDLSLFKDEERLRRYLVYSKDNLKYRIDFFSDTFPLEIDYSDIYLTDMLDTNWSEKHLFGYGYNFNSFNAQGGGSSNGENETSVEGNYSFNATNGTEMSGSLTLSNGEWSYSGSNKPAATSGTYTVNGSKITVNWTANGLSLNETFTVTKNGNSVTWKSDNEYSSTFLTMLFKVSATKLEVTFDYTE